MRNEEIWARLASATAARSSSHSQHLREELLTEALTLGSTITPDSVGCSITEAGVDGFRTPAASNALSLEIDQAQYEASDGPCVAACRDGRVHSIAVMTDEGDYPGFTAAALRRGVKSSLSVPLRGTSRPSALNLYAGSTSAFLPDHPQAVAMLLARCVSALIADRPAEGAAPRAAEDPAASPVQRAVRALTESAGLDSKAAFTELASRSRAEKRSIFQVADEVLAGSQRRGSDPTR